MPEIVWNGHSASADKLFCEYLVMKLLPVYTCIRLTYSRHIQIVRTEYYHHHRRRHRNFNRLLTFAVDRNANILDIIFMT